MENETFRSGLVAVLGRPNVGKSTLVNSLVGQKISIVTEKPQTTRHAIRGILTEKNYQAVFIDTPGLVTRTGKLINRAMNRAATGSLEGADLVFFVVEADRWREGDQRVLDCIQRSAIPCLLLLNKVDLIRPKSALLPFLEECANRGDFAEIVPVSGLRHQNLERLKEQIVEFLPEGDCLFPADARTDRGMGFWIGEVIREKLMASLRDEVPYGLCVEIRKVEERGPLVLVDAAIWVDRESHKPIVIGRAGIRLKVLGRAARLELENSFDRKFYLETRVKVRRNWADNANALRQLGYDVGA